MKKTAFKVVRAVISIILSGALFYVLYGTLGTAMEVMRQDFLAIIPNIKMSVAWVTINTTNANAANYFFDGAWVMLLAVIIYFILGAFTNQDIDRFANG